MSTYKYLHNGTYHADTSVSYMAALGIDDETQESILNQKAYEEEKANQASIDSLKSYLLSTDWIVAKIAEANVLGEDVELLTEKYADEISKRKTVRDEINELGG